mgnify:FL=1|jgi:hypothetical protein
MRIISQDDRIDIPYRLFGVAISRPYKENDKCEILGTFGKNVYSLGIYKNKQRAEEILQEIRERYKIEAKFYVMPKE